MKENEDTLCVADHFSGLADSIEPHSMYEAFVGDSLQAVSYQWLCAIAVDLWAQGGLVPGDEP